MNLFNVRLKQIRQSLNVTQKTIADYLKIGERSYQRYEYGEREPSLAIIIALADYFNVSLDYLVGRSDNPKKN